MVRHQRVVVSTLPLNRVYELSLLYFQNLGFSVIEQIPNTYIKFQRGSAWLGDTWQTKKMYLILNFSMIQDKKVAISCTYDFSTLLYEGSKDLENADREIYGFRNYIAEMKKQERKPIRICPKCKREIPWDAKICPYCGYDFSEVKKDKKENKQPLIVQEETKKNVKLCPNCGKDVPVDALFCPYCGYHFHQIPSVDVSQKSDFTYISPLPPQEKYDKDKTALAEKYAMYGVIWGILGILLFSLLGILGIYYGWKARKLDKSKGIGGIILGIISLTVGLFFDILLLSLL